MDKKPKVGIMALLGGPSSKKDEPSGDDMAIEALWRAIKDDDREGFAEAFREAVNSCGSCAEESSDEED